MLRVLIADDHQLFREGLANILNAQPDFEVVGEAADGLEAIVKVRKLLPDMVLMDIGMPGLDGVEATKLIKKEFPSVTIVMLTVQADEEHLFAAVINGAQGYLLKDIPSRELLPMLRAAALGEAAITPSLGGCMLEEFRRLSRQSTGTAKEELVSLTNREQEVLSLVAGGATDQEIAGTLTISIHTVKSHMRNILSKLQLNHRYEAARYAMREGLIHPPADSP